MGAALDKGIFLEVCEIIEANHKISKETFLNEIFGWWVGVNLEGKKQRWYIHEVTEELIKRPMGKLDGKDFFAPYLLVSNEYPIKKCKFNIDYLAYLDWFLLPFSYSQIHS